MDPSTGFLTARLAAAQAVPEAQRSPEIAGFIESCALRDDVAADLAAPMPASPAAINRHTCLLLLKAVRADHVCAGPPLDAYNSMHSALEGQLLATAQVHAMLCGGGLTSTSPAQQIVNFLRSDPTLPTVLSVVGGLLPPMLQDGPLEVDAALLELLQRPPVRQGLQAELAALQADLPRPLLTMNQLLARVADHAVHAAVYARLHKPGDRAAGDVYMRVLRLLPKLADLEPLPASACRLRYAAAMAAAGLEQSGQAWLLFTYARQQAEEAGCDYLMAMAGRQLAVLAMTLSARRETPRGVRPSDVLRWLMQADDALRRCKPVLPQLWTRTVDNMKQSAQQAQGWLEALCQAGDAWVPLGEAAFGEHTAGMSQVREAIRDGTIAADRPCDGCGRPSLDLKHCTACKVALYCSVGCQQRHWKEHREACKKQKALQASCSGGGGASTGVGRVQ